MQKKVVEKEVESSLFSSLKVSQELVEGAGGME